MSGLYVCVCFRVIGSVCLSVCLSVCRQSKLTIKERNSISKHVVPAGIEPGNSGTSRKAFADRLQHTLYSASRLNVTISARQSDVTHFLATSVAVSGKETKHVLFFLFLVLLFFLVVVVFVVCVGGGVSECVFVRACNNM